MESQIFDLEKQHWTAMENKDFETVRNLTRFPCIVTSKDGAKSVDEESFKKLFESDKSRKIKVVGTSGVHSQMIDENNGVLGYSIEMAFDADGKDAVSTFVCGSMWTKENNRWKCAMHSETPKQ